LTSGGFRIVSDTLVFRRLESPFFHVWNFQSYQLISLYAINKTGFICWTQCTTGSCRTHPRPVECTEQILHGPLTVALPACSRMLATLACQPQMLIVMSNSHSLLFTYGINGHASATVDRSLPWPLHKRKCLTYRTSVYTCRNHPKKRILYFHDNTMIQANAIDKAHRVSVASLSQAYCWLSLKTSTQINHNTHFTRGHRGNEHSRYTAGPDTTSAGPQVNFCLWDVTVWVHTACRRDY